MKILYYNWIAFDNPGQLGGGVNLYQRDLIRWMVTNDSEYDISFLSSGWKCNPLRKDVYVVPTCNIFGDKCHSYEIINSPIMAPSSSLVGMFDRYVSDEVSVAIFRQFLLEHGPFDVIHFNNLEGISVNVLALKSEFQNSKFVVTIHNYQTICPLAQYFNLVDNKVCRNFGEGVSCLACVNKLSRTDEYSRHCKNFFYGLLASCKYGKVIRPLFKLFSKFCAKCRKISGVPAPQSLQAKDYAAYRKHNVEMLNRYTDLILTVSERTRAIMLQHGIDCRRTYVCYIGSRFADKERQVHLAQVAGVENEVMRHGVFTICYLGYKRVDKGFYFLLDSLSTLDPLIATGVRVVLAVAKLNRRKIEIKLKHFKEVVLYDGYTHQDLENILQTVDLGIVPVLWEDNLPQVAIEMVACGVPILCSDLGGASELCSSPKFKFVGGSREDLLRKLVFLVQHPDILQEYWRCRRPLVTMEQHVLELKRYYQS